MGKSTGRWEIPAGIIGATIRFAYGSDWTNLSKTVVFDGCGVTKDVVNAGEEVTVPAEVVARPERKLLVGVYGVDGEKGTATPTLWLEGYVCAAADPSGDVTTDPALPVWAQLEARIRALEERNAICSVMYVLDHVLCSQNAASVSYQSSFTAELTAEDGYILDKVTVTMGGGDVTAEAYRDGRITIGSVTGDVVITAAAVAAQAEFVAYDAPTAMGYALNLSGKVIHATDNWLYTGFLPAAPGQTFRYVGDTSPYGEYSAVWGYDENGSPVKALVGNGNYTGGVEFVIPEGVYGIRCCWYSGAAHSLEVLAAQQDQAGEVPFTADIVVSGTGTESSKEGGGATDYIPAASGALVLVYNIVPANGGRIAVYDARKAFLEAVTIYTQGAEEAVLYSVPVTNESAAYVRISTNVLSGVRASVREGG